MGIDPYLHFRRGLSCIELNPDSRFNVPAEDNYWITWQPKVYEPELKWLLRRATNVPYCLVDCGANFGYWAILASSVEYGSHRVIAIEAARANFELLAYNSFSNGNRFQCMHRAVSDKSKAQVRLYGGTHHFMHSLRKEWASETSALFEDVDTITLDELAEYLPKTSYPPLVKLDVEGAEVEAMRGGKRLIDQGALIVYEDHGKESEHPPTDYVLSQGDLHVWFYREDGTLARIIDLKQVSEIKVDGAGYNFFAFHHGSPWATFFESPSDPKRRTISIPTFLQTPIRSLRRAFKRVANPAASRQIHRGC